MNGHVKGGNRMKYNIKVDLSVGTSHSLILNRIKPNTKILEFGPASGFMTQYMRDQLGCKVTCVEINEQAASIATEFAERMIIADIDQMDWYNKLIGESFDYVIFADVLEHLRNPTEILKTASSLLNNKGSIAISVPNITHNAIIMEMLLERFDYRTEGLLDETHIHFFTRKHLLEVLESAGMVPTEWMVTQRRPETTEFKQDYRRFPVEIRNYLRSKPDGHVYQFVVFAQNGTQEMVENEVFDLNHENYLDADYLQVYWGIEDLFSEEHSVRTAVKSPSSREKTVYLLTLPNDAYGRIRIDLGSTIVSGMFDKINIYKINEEKKENVFLWEAASDHSCPFRSKDLIMVRNSTSVEFVSISNDSFIILEGFELLEGNGPFYLEITLVLDDNISRVVSFLNNRLITEKEEKERVMSERNLENIKYENETSHLESDRNNLNEKVVNLENERIKLTVANSELAEKAKNYEQLYKTLKSEEEARNRLEQKINEISQRVNQRSLLERIWQRLSRKRS